MTLACRAAPRQPCCVSPFSTRTKIAVGVGVIVCAGAWLVLSPGARPQLTASFVRYADSDGLSPIFEVTNYTAGVVTVDMKYDDGTTVGPPVELPAHSSITFSYDLASPAASPRHIVTYGYPWSLHVGPAPPTASKVWLARHARFLFRLGILKVPGQPDFTIPIVLPPPPK